MTTRIDIDAHAGWPVKVEHFDILPAGDRLSNETVVAPNTKASVHVWDNRYVVIKEQRHPDYK